MVSSKVVPSSAPGRLRPTLRSLRDKQGALARVAHDWDSTVRRVGRSPAFQNLLSTERGRKSISKIYGLWSVTRKHLFGWSWLVFWDEVETGNQVLRRQYLLSSVPCILAQDTCARVFGSVLRLFCNNRWHCRNGFMGNDPNGSHRGRIYLYILWRKTHASRSVCMKIERDCKYYCLQEYSVSYLY